MAAAPLPPPFVRRVAYLLNTQALLMISPSVVMQTKNHKSQFKHALTLFIGSLTLMIGCGVAKPVDQSVLAKQLLMQSYAARYELGAISNVTVSNETANGVSFDVTGSKKKGTFAVMGRLTPNSVPICSITLEDGRQIPLFQDFLEESYKRDLETE